MKKQLKSILGIALLAASCSPEKEGQDVVFVTLDPGHFHAALVQKTQLPDVSRDVYVYAPAGEDLEQHLQKIEGYNTRAEDPTSWNEIVYRGEDFLAKMIAGKKGNVVVSAGNNARKTEYIKKSLDAGFNVLADKPMAIDSTNFELLKECFVSAEKNGVLLYDIMTERFEISTILQKELSLIPEVYGTQEQGSPENPGIVIESVHNFYKNVSGSALTRPAWFYDVTQQGECIVDVMVHLVDLVQWVCFPDQILDYTTDIKFNSARHWPTTVNPAQFKASTGLDEYPDFLMPNVVDGVLNVYANGEINYQLKGLNAKVVALWDYEAPAGAGDSHYCMMRGSRANLVIRQGEAQKYVPELYIEPAVKDGAYASQLEKSFASVVAKYPGVSLEPAGEGWHVVIPAGYRVGHEAHFGQVTENFLNYLKDGALPEWEVPNMIAKYYTTTTAWRMVQ